MKDVGKKSFQDGKNLGISPTPHPPVRLRTRRIAIEAAQRRQIFAELKARSREAAQAADRARTPGPVRGATRWEEGEKGKWQGMFSVFLLDFFWDLSEFVRILLEFSFGS